MIGDFPVDRCAIVNGVGQGFVRFLGEIFLHCLPVEDILAIVLRYFVFGSNGFHGLSVDAFSTALKREIDIVELFYVLRRKNTKQLTIDSQ